MFETNVRSECLKHVFKPSNKTFKIQRLKRIFEANFRNKLSIQKSLLSISGKVTGVCTYAQSAPANRFDQFAGLHESHLVIV